MDNQSTCQGTTTDTSDSQRGDSDGTDETGTLTDNEDCIFYDCHEESSPKQPATQYFYIGEPSSEGEEEQFEPKWTKAQNQGEGDYHGRDIDTDVRNGEDVDQHRETMQGDWGTEDGDDDDATQGASEEPPVKNTSPQCMEKRGKTTSLTQKQK